MLLEQNVYPPLLEGKYEGIKIKSYGEKAGVAGKDNYVQIELEFPNGRVIIDNIFSSTFQVAMSQLQQQVVPEAIAIPAGELLALASQGEITIYINYVRPVGASKRYRNINFMPPIEGEVPALVGTLEDEEDF